MAKNVKIYEIAKAMGIPSGELVKLCQRIGYEQITHHAQAVTPAEADEIRRKAFLRYRPPEPPKPKPQPVAKPEPESEKPKAEAAREAKPVPPPAKRGGGQKPAAKAPEKPAKKKREVPSTKDVRPVLPPKPVAHRRAEAEDEETVTSPQAERRRRRRERERGRREAQVTKRTVVFKQPKRPIQQKEKPSRIEVESPVTLRQLSEAMGVPAGELIKELMFEHGIRANINAAIEDEVVQLLGISRDIEVVINQPQTAEDQLIESLPEDKPEDMVSRPPVIAMLGHVDHGKTSILDRIRNTTVAEHESGGITQHIGAWQAEVEGHTITFVDTPGHEAFTAMRARGAKVTDIVVLVVAADDGVMPQTVEAINHAKAAEVPIVVALNKIDKPDANPMRVLQQLAGYDLNPEEWGGETGIIKVSAITGEGIDELLERIVLEAELHELKANPDRAANGAVIEARMEPGRGPVTHVIVEGGTLHKGDVVVCGNAFGFVRALYDDHGNDVSVAGPSMPVSISGLDKVPEAGETFLVVDSLDAARKVAQERDQQLQREKLQPRSHVTLDNLYESLQSGKTKTLNIVLKADVQGTLDPVLNSLADLGTDEVSVKIIHNAVGRVNSGDVLLADASDAIIVAFRVPAGSDVRDMAHERGIEIVHYDVIYNVVEEIRASLEGMLAPEKVEEFVGRAQVRALFRISRLGTIAGCFVTDGAIRRNCRVKVVRGGEAIYEGPIASLKQEKNDVREVEAGRECGIRVEGFNDLQEGDLIECFTIVTVRRKLG